MRGRQRLAASVAAIACVANIVLNTILIPRWGMTGAAAATAISTVIWAGTMAIATRRTLKLRMSLLARGDA